MHTHGHHHHHGHTHSDHELTPEESDSSSQSLADALRVSFRILKLIMIIVVLLYCGSGLETLEQNQKAVVLRFGKIHQVKGPGGLVVALPSPIDEIIRIPVTEKRIMTIESQDLFRKVVNGVKQERSKVNRSGGLDPKMDGSIITADRGLVHGTWVVVYEIEDLQAYVSNVYGAEENAENELLQHAVESAANEVIGQMNAIDVTGEQLYNIQINMRESAQATLSSLNTGIRIASVDARTNWPKQAEKSFAAANEAGNELSKKIKEAQGDREEWLNKTAGDSYKQLEVLLNQYMNARANTDAGLAQDKMKQIEQIILTQSKGLAGERIFQARSYKKEVLEDIEADVQEFRAHLAAYERNPMLLMNRLWTDAQMVIFDNPEVSKRYLPAGQKEIRLQISPDPIEKEEREESEYRKKQKAKGFYSDSVDMSRNPRLKQSRQQLR